jgi:PadR family transcriptional regulator PadR
MSHTTLTLLQGTVDLLILRALQAGPAHGYAVSRWVRERTDGVLSMEDAALYQALHRLEGKAWIASEWGLSENNRRAKYYSLTPDGRRQLRSEVSVWRRYAEAVFKVIETA